MFLASSTIVPLFQAGIIGRVLFTVALAYITPNQVEFITLKWIQYIIGTLLWFVFLGIHQIYPIDSFGPNILALCYIKLHNGTLLLSSFECPKPRLHVNSASYKVWLFVAIFMDEITLNVIDMQKKRFTKPLFALSIHFENQPSITPQFLQHLRLS